MENEEKKSKKGLFRVTKVKVATLATALLVAAGALFGTDNPIKDHLLGNTNTEMGENVGNGDGENQPKDDNAPATPTPAPEEPEPTSTPEPTTTPEPGKEPAPGDEGYYFDEEDPKDTLGDEEEANANTSDANIDQTNQAPVVNDDFADLVIPNINAYKGRGNSIIDALKYCGYPSDRAYRARLAAFFEIEDYQYLGYQNLQLMDYLYQYYAYLDNSQETNTNTNTTTNPGNGNSNASNKTESNQQDEQHTCDFGDWESLNDEKEIRKCSCGKFEERNHNYGPWVDLGNGKEARFCKNCGHAHVRNKQQEEEKHQCSFGEWESYNDEKERRNCSCGKFEERDHKYGPWLDLGNGKEARICNNCGHVHERTKQQECDHTLGAWKDNGDGTCSRECACGQEKETKSHVQGTLVSSKKYVNDKN